MAKNDSTSSQASNCETIHIEGERARKFHSLLADIADAATSLRTASTLFPNDATVTEGKMHPTTTIRAFSLALDELVGEAMNIAHGDDLKQAEREARHAQD